MPTANGELSKPELQELVEGWTPRIFEGSQEALANVGAAGAGALAGKIGTGPLIAIGSIGTLVSAVVGPSHPWWQLMLAPFRGTLNGAVAIRTFQMFNPTQAGIDATS